MTRVLRKGILLVGAALMVSQLTYASSTPERLVFDGNVLFNNLTNFGSGAGVCTTSVAPLTTISFTSQDLATVYATHNKIGMDPKLVAPYNLNNPRWDPQQTS